MGLFGDRYGGHFESIVSNSYFGMLGSLKLLILLVFYFNDSPSILNGVTLKTSNLPPEHPLIKK